MKKSLLTLTFGLLASTSVLAANITDPFYQPAEKGFLSDTSISYQNLGNGDAEGALLTETLSYGVSRKLAVTGTIADTYNLHGRMKKKENWSNLAWGVGVKYNLIDCEKTNLKVQVGANYTQGTNAFLPFLNVFAGTDPHMKSVSAYTKIGVEAAEGFVPYATGTVVKPIGDREKDPYWVGRLAVYKTLTDVVSVDFGYDYIYDGATAGGKHGHVSAFDGAINYQLSDTLSLGLTGEYALDVRPGDADYYTIGLNLKATF